MLVLLGEIGLVGISMTAIALWIAKWYRGRSGGSALWVKYAMISLLALSECGAALVLASLGIATAGASGILFQDGNILLHEYVVQLLRRASLIGAYVAAGSFFLACLLSTVRGGK